MEKLTNEPWPRSCLQVYTGNGKGKTTASLGLTLRAVGRGMKVFIGQFMKKQRYGELNGIAMLGDSVTLEQYGSPNFIFNTGKPSQKDIDLAEDGLARCRAAINSGKYQIVIMDEINVAVHFKLIQEAELLALVDSRPQDVELICTGRNALPALIEKADLVTEMKPIKHPYEQDKLPARDGIEK